jgi:hypothetical protein
MGQGSDHLLDPVIFAHEPGTVGRVGCSLDPEVIDEEVVEVSEVLLGQPPHRRRPASRERGQAGDALDDALKGSRSFKAAADDRPEFQEPLRLQEYLRSQRRLSVSV